MQEGDAFLTALDAHMRRYLSRGIPSLFVDIRPLFREPAKLAAAESLAESYADSLRSSSAFPAAAGASTSGSTNSSVNAEERGGGEAGTSGRGDEAESPQTLVWVLYFLARHYDRLVSWAASTQVLVTGGLRCCACDEKPARDVFKACL